LKLELFISAILEATNVSTHTLLTSLFLMMKLSKVIELEGLAGSEFRLWTTRYSIEFLTFPSLLISNAFHEDNAFTAKSFSEVSKLPLQEIVTMKMDFLELICYDVSIPHKEYMDWLRVLDSTYAFYTLYPPLVPLITRIPSPPGGSSPYFVKARGDQKMIVNMPPSPPKRFLSQGRSFQLLI
jgi:hypothetical protein